MTSPKTLYLVDASSLIYRAYHAIRYLSSPSGVPTNAVFGFGSMLLKLLTEKKPDYLVAVFDAPPPTFRHEIYEEYKSHRPPVPEDLMPQFELCRDLMAALGVFSLEKQGFEADDIIATLTHRAKPQGVETVIVSGDKDLMVLIDDDVSVYDSMREKVYSKPEVVEKFGVGPERLLDVLALMGDTSDNIPGVPGVGKKTAAALVRAHGDLDSILEAASRGAIKGKRGQKLVEHRRDALTAKKLIALRDDVEIDIPWDRMHPGPARARDLEPLLEKLSFKKWLESLDKIYEAYGRAEGGGEPRGEDAKPKSHRPKHEPARALRQPAPERYESVCTLADWERLFSELREKKRFAVDLETTSLDPIRARLVGFALSTGPGRGFYVPVGHTTLEDRKQQLKTERILSDLASLLEDPEVRKYAQNHKYEYVVLKRLGVELRGVACDPMIASYLLDPSHTSHGLDALARRELGYDMLTFKEVCGSGRSAVTFDQITVERATRYAAEDAEATYILGELLEEHVENQGLGSLMTDVEIPLSRVLGIMELNGVAVDTTSLARLSDEMAAELASLQTQVTEIGGLEVNINSPKQLQVLLFEHLGLQPIRRTKTGYSTDAEVLYQLASLHPVAAVINDYRTISKLRSTYAEALPKLVNPETGRIHTSYNQAVAATGRLSSSDPNLQNIPIRTKLGKKIRRAFVAPEGKKLVSCDYSQIELRVLAHLSKDEKLTQAFRNGEDVHTRTACEVFGLEPGEVDQEERRVAKAVNFGVIYGQSAFGLAKQLRIPRREASQYIERYFERYQGVATFMDELIEGARASGRVSTILGRRRPLPGLSRGKGRHRSAAERMARNTPIQGSAADLIKLAMLRCQHRLEQDFPSAKMVLSVHDELVFEVEADRAEDLGDAMAHEMEGVWPLDVPLVVDVGVGNDWEEAH